MSVIIGNQVIYSDGFGSIIMKPVRLCVKHNIQINNIPIITTGNVKQDNNILQQLLMGTMNINDLVPIN